MEKIFLGLITFFSAMLGASIGTWGSWNINKQNRQKERLEELRRHITSVFYVGRKIKNRDYDALISECEHCLTILYNKDKIEAERKLYNNIKLIMDKAREMEDIPGADISDDLITEELIEETMHLAHDVFKTG